MSSEFVVIGHRGMGPTSTLHEEEFTRNILPENSLAAFEQAIMLGADGVEFDVHLTADDRLAVIHDDELNKKLYNADRIGQDLGLVSDYRMKELQDPMFDIGHGHTIPSLTDVLDLIVSENEARRHKSLPNLIINIELKGRGVVENVHEEISEYISDGRLNREDFVFCSFVWDRLRRIKEIDTDYKVVPAIRTVDLFGPDQVTMPGYLVEEDAKYQEAGLDKLQKFHDGVGVHAFDCIVFDLRPEFVNFCKDNRVGLFTSTSQEAIKADQIEGKLGMMIDASAQLPQVCFRADNVYDTNRILKRILIDKSLLEQVGSITSNSQRRLPPMPGKSPKLTRD